MKAAIVFTGGGPVIFLTSYGSFKESGFIKKLAGRGISKFIAYEIPIDEVKRKYAKHFKAVTNDVKESDDLRCLDYNGFNVFHNFSFKELGEPVYHEP
ncbi:MAG: hypothetical protein V2J25_14455 [Desulfatiglans sp.]|jgi:hypothetical protein|nr:hypothetical protein [Thermodesulfobacteriota bacterium]MEE4354061.1 hypothetical protein [Desulfatiglans sp.]